ncbi:MAG: biotin synthase BioB [Candidatus Binatia bacterium]|jgi:biotin synthase|nr:biotin synthase BioB [Candidatus Binatia bacterium]
MDYDRLAEKSLRDEVLTREEMRSVLQAPDENLPVLLQSAFRVRHHYFGKRVQIHVLMNAKSGLCPEDCHYCSQSSVSTAPIDKYPLLAKEKLIEGARRAKEAGAVRYCMVTSGRGSTAREIEEMVEVVRGIKDRVPISICCSLGLLTEDKAKVLKEAGVDRVNHNLNTSRNRYADICKTHTYDDRLETVGNVKSAGLSTCCGGIMGIGEDDEDLMELALSLRELDVESIPVNFLHPIPGTPLQGVNQLTPQRCLKGLCLFRFLNPTKEIRVAGGRELHLRSLQPLSLYPANSIFVNGYLTTWGQESSDAHRMVEDLGFEIETGDGPSARLG